MPESAVDDDGANYWYLMSDNPRTREQAGSMWFSQISAQPSSIFIALSRLRRIRLNDCDRDPISSLDS